MAGGETAGVLMFVDVLEKSSLYVLLSGRFMNSFLVAINCLAALSSVQLLIELYWHILEKLPEYFKDTMDWFMG